MFRYTPLDHNDPYAFRLLRLLPAHEPAPIEVVLEHANRPSARVASQNAYSPHHLSYRALSYTWGNENTKFAISVNNFTFLVTPNLYEALRSLRRAPEEQASFEFFWIDAICINQHDLPERSFQVTQMQEIYENAREVIIWLGPLTLSTSVAIDFIEETYPLLQRDGGFSPNGIKSDREKLLPQFTIANIIDLVTNNRNLEWQAVIELLRNPWWERSWIIQELACASVATFLCGKKRLQWEKMADMMKILFTRHSKLKTLSSLNEFFKRSRPELSRAVKLHFIRESYRLKRQVGLGELNSDSLLICGYDYLATQAQLTQCKNPRDKVYAFLGLASANFRSYIKPDYSQPVAWIYAMVVKTNYHCCNNLNILRAIDDGLSHINLPSWTLDLNSKTTLKSHSLLFGNAAGEWSTSVPRPLDFSGDLKCMEVDGFTVDIIQDSKLQGNDYVFSLKTGSDEKAALVEYLIYKLIYMGGIRNPFKSKAASEHQRTRQRIEGAIYNVLTAGTAWCSNTVRHEPLKIEFLEDSSGSGTSRPENLEAIYHESNQFTRSRTLILSKTRYFGLAPASTRPGDHICIIFGLGFPAILRPRDDGAWSFVGTAYVNGLMEGEAMKRFEGRNPLEFCQKRFKLR